MAMEEPSRCVSEVLTIEHIVMEYRRYQTIRTNLNISENIDTSLGPNPIQNEAIINFFKIN